MKIVFLHVPKCAGTALRKALISTCQSSSTISLFDFSYCHRLRRYVDLAHLPLDDLRHFPEWRYLKQYKTVACIRHPYKRLASACREFYRQKSRSTQQQMLTEIPTEEQVRDYLSALPGAIDSHDIRYIHGFPIVRFTHYGRKPMVDALLRTERLDQDLRNLSQHCALTPQQCEAIAEALSTGRPKRQIPSLEAIETSDELRAAANLLHREDFTTFCFEQDHRPDLKQHDSLRAAEHSLSRSESHAIPHLSLAPRVQWYWGRSSAATLPPLRATRRRQRSASVQPERHALNA